MNIDTTMYGFMRAYREKGNSVAVARGVFRISFSRLFREIERVAGGLYALGVRKGDVVMSALPNIEQGVALLYAASRLGAVLSPVHPLVSKLEFEREVKLQKPKVVVLSDVNFADFGTLCGGAKKVFCPYWAHVYVGLPFSKRFEEYKGNGSIPALYMHSGGTSGTPKTVVLSAKAANALVYDLLSAIPYEFSEKDGMLVTLPMFHGFGLIAGVHLCLCSSMRAILIPKFSGERTVRATKRNRATTMIAVPRMIRKLLDTPSFCGDAVKTLNNVYVGGDALDVQLIEEFNQRMKEAGATAVAQQGYGLTEMGSVCALSPKEGGDPISVGRAICGVRAEIADFDGDGQGELLLASEQLMDGYLGKDDKDWFVVLDGVKYLRTGDIFRKHGEDLYYLGRAKRLIKISGMNVFPSEIERVAGELEFVRACAAYEYAQNGKTYIGLAVEGELSESQKKAIVDRISAKLSHWHKPSEIVCTAELPRTSIGKIDFMRVQNEHRKN